jgi:lipase ATG15
VVISFKGTSTIVHGGETVARDKYMDNIMFSCCCARVDISWTPVCGCYRGQTQCDATCLAKTIQDDKTAYYHEALAVVQLVLAKYPRAQLWFTGHSLGGAIAALMAVTVRNTAAITFSSPGPYLYARHLGLDTDAPGTQWRHPVWNFGLTSDPIFTGTCTGLVTSCYLSGYAMETAGRHGMDCTFDVTSWQPDVSTHRIDWFIDHVLEKPEKYPLPVCLPNRNCTDCLKWTFT